MNFGGYIAISAAGIMLIIAAYKIGEMITKPMNNLTMPERIFFSSLPFFRAALGDALELS